MARPKYETPCKLGSIPAVVRVHGSDVIELDRMVRVQEMERGDWMAVIVKKVNPCGHFTASRHFTHPPLDRTQPAAGEYAYAEG